MNTPTSRRHFLKTFALLPLALAAGGGVRSAIAAVQPPQRVGGASVKISLNAYSFAKLLNENLADPGRGLSLLKLVEFCALHDFDAIDPTAYYFPGYRER